MSSLPDELKRLRVKRIVCPTLNLKLEDEMRIKCGQGEVQGGQLHGHEEKHWAVKSHKITRSDGQKAYRVLNELIVLSENSTVHETQDDHPGETQGTLVSLGRWSLEMNEKSEIIVRILTNFEPGNNLSEWLKRAPLNLATRLSWIIDIAMGLSDLHSRGWVHRDVKAENVLIAQKVVPIVCDFGLSQRDGTIDYGYVGTLGYMAPELVISGDARFVSTKDDVFAFGVLALLVLSWKSNPVELLFEKCDDPHPKLQMLKFRDAITSGTWKLEQVCQELMENYQEWLPHDFHSVVEIIRQCLDVDPAQRPSMSAVHTRLNEIFNTGNASQSDNSDSEWLSVDEDDVLDDIEDGIMDMDGQNGIDAGMTDVQLDEKMTEVEKSQDKMIEVSQVMAKRLKMSQVVDVQVDTKKYEEQLETKMILRKTADLIRNAKSPFKVSLPNEVSSFPSGILKAIGDNVQVTYDNNEVTVRIENHAVMPMAFVVSLSNEDQIGNWSLVSDDRILAKSEGSGKKRIHIWRLDTCAYKFALQSFKLILDCEAGVSACECFGVVLPL